MAKIDELDDLLEEQEGIITIKQVMATGVSKSKFYENIDYYELEKVAHGVYVSKDAWVDPMYILHLRCPQAIFSHESALLLHDLTVRDPLSYSVTVKTGYNPSNLKNDQVHVYTIKKDLHEVGVTNASTTYGHEVKVYNMERTICDVLRSRSQIEMQNFQDALRAYFKRKDKDLHVLMQYAQLFKVENIIKPYLEVLL